MTAEITLSVLFLFLEGRCLPIFAFSVLIPLTDKKNLQCYTLVVLAINLHQGSGFWLNFNKTENEHV